MLTFISIMDLSGIDNKTHGKEGAFFTCETKKKFVFGIKTDM
jgi:hypothetical protein